MSRSESIACTQCDGLAGDRCMVHDVEIENPAFTVCGAFRVVDTSPEELASRFPILAELRPDWIYELDPSGEPSPWLQVTRRRRGWRARLKSVLESYIRVLMATPGLAQLALRTIASGPSSLRVIEALLDAAEKMTGAHP